MSKIDKDKSEAKPADKDGAAPATTVASAPATAPAPAAAPAAPEPAAAPAPAAPEPSPAPAPAAPEPSPVAAPVDLKAAAAKFAGIAVDQVFDFAKQPNGRFVVVTVSGQKISRTPDERVADAAAAKKAADERQAAREARNTKR